MDLDRLSPIFTATLVASLFAVSATLLAGSQLTDARPWRDTPEWDYLIFVQQWPPSACMNAEQEGHECKIPSQVSTWTVHGLWPTSFASEGPNNCNKSWHFNVSKIDSLRSKLNVEWPNLFPKKSEWSFWKHEWVKHGTCAASDERLRGEMNYFSSTLNIKQKYSLEDLLDKGDIRPTTTLGYEVKNISSVLAKGLGVEKVIVQCFFENPNKTQGSGHLLPLLKPATKKTHKTQYLLQIEICLDKTNFEPIDCQHNSNCNQNPIYYPTFGEDRKIRFTVKDKSEKFFLLL